MDRPLPYQRVPRTLGDHLRRRWYQLGLRQADVAARIGASVNNLIDWEANRHAPAVWFVPRIIAFLDYDPHPVPRTIGERIVAARRSRGLSRKRLAKLLGVDEGTLKRWEEDRCAPGWDHLAGLESFLALHGTGH